MSKSYDQFLEDLAARESSGNYGITNPETGYAGKYQMGEGALIDTGYYLKDGTTKVDFAGQWTGKDGIKSLADFLSNPAVQDKATRLYVDVQWGYIKYNHLDNYLGQTVGGIEITKSGLIAGAHLMGVGGLKTFLQSNGQVVPRDGNKKNGVPITEYISKFGGYSLTDNTSGDRTVNPISSATTVTNPDNTVTTRTIYADGTRYEATYQGDKLISSTIKTTDGQSIFYSYDPSTRKWAYWTMDKDKNLLEFNSSEGSSNLAGSNPTVTDKTGRQKAADANTLGNSKKTSASSPRSAAFSPVFTRLSPVLFPTS